MNYWLHRISHHAEVSYPLIERGILSVGWSELSSDKFFADCSDIDNFNGHLEEVGWGLPRNRYSLWRFISEMDKDDYVLVPSWGTFSIYKIIDDQAYNIEKFGALMIGALKKNCRSS